ncbi:MAG: aldo/keto reductase, partial [Silvanigrellaceae bacterium]|nr:aldo/keto reductase [Silvanigrellaceae bacterium]
MLRKLGKTDIQLNRIGLGCMGMSEIYEKNNLQDNISTLEKAVEIGVNLFDTAEAYGAGENEKLIGNILKKYKDKVYIATKTGIERFNDNLTGKPQRKTNNSKEFIKNACEASLKRLQTDVIDLYFIHRIDKTIPIEETMRVLEELYMEGKIRAAGLSEVSLDNLKRAHSVFPVSAVQSEFSIITRDYEKDILPFCEENQISFISYSPFSQGLLTKKVKTPSNLEKNDFRNILPRFEKENFEKNNELITKLEEFCIHKNITLPQLCLAWILNKSISLMAIPGTT